MVIAFWPRPGGSGIIIIMSALIVGITTGTIGVSLFSSSRVGRGFKKRLRYWCRINPRPFKEVDELMRNFLDRNFIEYRIIDTLISLNFFSVSGDLRAFVVRFDSAGMKTKTFGIAYANKSNDDILADFRAQAIRDLGLNECDLEL